ncbi:MAG: GDYXXLXY domain-containing protein [Anaerolineae bacterium]|nr:GDYXXLXY domain-containing protein [Anaerolineae bacterium]
MKRLMTAAVIAALALPLATLGAMVGDAERGLRDAGVMRVAIRGYDPQDMLRGHYLRYQFEWNAEPAFIGRARQLCVLSAPADAPARVRPLAESGTWSSATDCAFVVKGWGEVLAEGRRLEPGERGPAGRLRFTPSGVESGRLYIPERHAQELERLLRGNDARLTIDLAVNRAGRASVKAWHIDGKTVDDYFNK